MVPERDFPSHLLALSKYRTSRIIFEKKIDSNMADKQVARRDASHFTKLSPSEHVLQCPEMFIGSMIPVTNEKTLVYDYATQADATGKMACRAEQ